MGGRLPRLLVGAIFSTVVAFRVSGMGFWETVIASVVAFLVGTVLVGGVAIVWSQVTRPRISISVYGSTLSSKQPIRWLHGQVVAKSDTAALHPQLMVRPPDATNYEQWAWPGHKTHPAIPPTPILIPVVLGNHTNANAWLASGIPVSPGQWTLTPDNGGTLGRNLVMTANHTYRFGVRVMWLRDGTKHAHQDAEFEVRLGAIGTEPEFVMVEHRWRARYALRKLARRP